MIIAEGDIKSLVQLHQWLKVMAEISSNGLIELQPEGLIFRACNFVDTAFIELSIDTKITFYKFECLYININLVDFLEFIDTWIKGKTMESHIVFQPDMILLQNSGQELSFPITLSRKPFKLTSKDFADLPHVTVQCPIPELQNMIRELCLVGEFVHINITPKEELQLLTPTVKESTNEELQLHTNNFEEFLMQKGIYQITDQTADWKEGINLRIALCNLKKLTILHTSKGIIRLIPNRFFIFETGGQDGMKLSIFMSSD